MFRIIGNLLALLAIIVVPCIAFVKWFVAPNADTVIRVFPIFIATTAFMTAVYALYSKDERLRGNSEFVLIAVIFSTLADIVLLFTFFMLNAVKTWFTDASSIIGFHLSTGIYFISVYVLFIHVFLRTYNQVYNLRTNKFFRHFRPIRIALESVQKPVLYESNSKGRSTQGEPFAALATCLSADERQQLLDGGTVLLTGVPTSKSLDVVINLLKERLEQNETANFISTDRHPFDIWQKMKATATDPNQVKTLSDIVFIDAFTPSFGFTDGIYRDRDEQLKNDDVGCLTAKGFAGLHTATNEAFKLIKSRDQKRHTNALRRPTIMVYFATSQLCDFESVEQFRIFWRHVIPSERGYGMVTIIVEDELAGDKVLDPLKQQADLVLAFKREEGNSLTMVKEKGYGC